MINLYRISIIDLDNLIYPELSGLSTIWDLGNIDEYKYFHLDENVTVPSVANKGPIERIALTESLCSLLKSNAPEHLKPYFVTFDQIKFNKIREITSAYENTMGAITYDYPISEISSWSKQEAEARAFVLDNSTPTPLLLAIANARGLTVEFLVPRVIAKSDAFAEISGTIIGKRQKLEYEISLVTENSDYVTAFNNIVWS